MSDGSFYTPVLVVCVVDLFSLRTLVRNLACRYVQVIFQAFLYHISAASLNSTRYSGDRITDTRSYFPLDLGGQTKWGATNVINNSAVLGVILVRVASLLPDTKH